MAGARRFTEPMKDRGSGSPGRVNRERFLADLLRGVSRSFYLTLRVLPRGIREPVGLAYLLARAADTISDTRILPPPERLTYLRAFRAQVMGQAAQRAPGDLAARLTDMQSASEELALLNALPSAVWMLEELPEADRDMVRAVVERLTYGMEIDLTGFPDEGSGRVVALKDRGELDRYVYYVAGCVGEFWTSMTMAHSAALSGWDANRMSETGVRFGKALQMTNILRDVPKDLRIGRCYLPQSDLVEAGVTPEDLLDPSAGSRARPVLVANLEVALGYYRAAEEYLLAIPRRCLRLRLAVLWPLLIGLATLGKLARNDDWLDPARPSKVSRAWIYRTLALSVPCALSNTLIRAWIGRLRRAVETAI